MDAYGDFSAVYDELMDNVPYGQWCERLQGLIEKYGVSKPVRDAEDALASEPVRDAEDALASEPVRDAEDALASERNLVLDLGCGTGTLTELMYRKGYDMIGADVSQDMLNVALEKRAAGGDSILYLNQDMRELELYSTVGTVYSVCDSLNYILEEEELVTVFSLVNNYLYPGGIFIFDFNTVYKYEKMIGDTTIAENREDCSFIWENFYDPEDEINEYDLTVFVKQEGDLFRKFTETHLQRGYRAEQMRKLVERAGMKLLEMADADTGEAVTAESQRIYIVAQEQGKTEQKAVKESECSGQGETGHRGTETEENRT